MIGGNCRLYGYGHAGTSAPRTLVIQIPAAGNLSLQRHASDHRSWASRAYEIPLQLPPDIARLLETLNEAPTDRGEEGVRDQSAKA
jgi:hypothetical protein